MPRRRYFAVAGLVAVLIIGGVRAGASVQLTQGSDWQQAQSYGFRLGVAPSSVGQEAVTATFDVQGPGLDGLQSRTDRKLEPGRFTYVFFPDDFHRKPLPGRYLWTCRVGSKVVAQGQFAYPSLAQ